MIAIETAKSIPDPRARRLILAAFTKWRTGKHIAVENADESSKYVIRGIGGRHLLQAEVGAHAPFCVALGPLTEHGG